MSANPATTAQFSGFDDLLWDLFAQLMDVPTDRVEEQILSAQRTICNSLGLDRSILWQTRPAETARLLLTHAYDAEQDSQAASPPDGSHPRSPGHEFGAGKGAIRRNANAFDHFPGIAKRVLRGEPTIIDTVDDLSPDASEDEAYLRRIGAISTVIVPLEAHGSILGCVSFGTVRRRQTWSRELVSRFERIAQVFARALVRKRADEKRRESDACLDLAVASTEAGLWDLDLATGRITASERVKRQLGFSAGEHVDLEKVLGVVHPEDRRAVREQIDAVLCKRDGFSAEGRVQMPDGSIRWLAVRGRPYEGSSGGPDRVLGVAVDITQRKGNEAALRRSLAEIGELKGRLEAEDALHREVLHVQDFESIVGHSAALGRVLDQVRQVAPTDAPVLLLGETGTGKDLVARALHDRSRRRERPMVSINCAALPATLIESELFGYERGAFTGALQRTIGRFELADEGTIFLDEIGELPGDVQAKLLRVVQSGEFERLGSSRTIRTNVRLIAATNRDLDHAMRENLFRPDLYYRLSVFPVKLPPLRDRPEDIPLLVWHFVARKQAQLGRSIKRIPDRLMRALCSYPWPGNVRELENVIERALILSNGTTLAADSLLFTPARQELCAAEGETLEDVERAYIRAVLVECNWKVSGPGNAADRLGLNRSTLQFRMKRLGITRPADGT